MKTHAQLARLQAQMRAEQPTVKRGRGRPRLPIDPVQVSILAGLDLNNKEIAARLPCDRKTLRRFAPELARARARRQVLAKLSEYQAVLRGDVAVLRRAVRAVLNQTEATGAPSHASPARKSAAGGSQRGDKWTPHRSE